MSSLSLTAADPKNDSRSPIGPLILDEDYDQPQGFLGYPTAQTNPSYSFLFHLDPFRI